jgi:2'-5' RNA ligase
MRLFTAIDLTEEVRGNIESLLDRLRPTARLRWSKVHNMHVTTKFIGEWPPERLQELISALSAMPPSGAIPIAVRGLGWFPNAKSPRVFWAGIEATGGLRELARNTEQVASRLGIPEETRTYSPHLTLARIQMPVDLTALRKAIDALPSTEFGSFSAGMHSLYESKLSPGGSNYTKIAEFPL